jgi:hypothetical protein
MDTLLEEMADVRDYALWLVLLAGVVGWLVVVRTLPAAIFGAIGVVVGAAVGIPLGG